MMNKFAKSKTRNKKGFIQIPILIAVIVGVIVVGGGGYFGYTQFKNYQAQQAEEEKQTQELAKTQQEALEKSQQEMERLKQEIAQKTKELARQVSEGQEVAQQQQKELEQKQKELEEKQKELEESQDIEIHFGAPYNLSDIFDKWKPYIVEIECEFRDSTGRLTSVSGGSGTLMRIDQPHSHPKIAFHLDPPYTRILTNKHVLEDKYGNTPSSCKIFNFDYNWITYGFLKNVISYEGSISKHPDYDWGTIKLPTGHKTIQYFEQILDEFNPADHLCGHIPITEGWPSSGDEIIVLGFPEIGAGDDVTITRGIISGLEGNYYLTDAKVDHGNSGGAAIHLEYDCFLGIPTAAAVGEIESLGRIFGDVAIFGSMSPKQDQEW